MPKRCKRSIALMLVVALIMSVLAACDGVVPDEQAAQEEWISSQTYVSVNDLVPELQEKYRDSEKYEYTDPLYDLKQNHKFTIELGFKPLDLGYKSYTEILGIYQDPEFTINFLAKYDAEDIEAGEKVEIGPPREPNFAIGSTLYEDGRIISLDPIDYRLFDNGEYAEWGNGRQYYMVQWVDYATGEKLEKPKVTIFTMEHELEAPNAEFYVTEDGSAAFRWNKVEGATGYYIVKAETNNERNRFSTTIPIGYSEETSWVYNNKGSSLMNSAFRIRGKSEDYLLWMEAGKEVEQEGNEGGAETEKEENYYKNYYGIIAVNDKGASPVSRLYDGEEIASRLPYKLASNVMKEEGLRTRKADSIGLLPAQLPIVMCDNTIVRRPLTYQIEKAKLKKETWLEYSGEKESPLLEEFENVSRDRLYIPYTIDGTNFADRYVFSEFDADTYKEEMQALQKRQEALKGRSGAATLGRDVELAKPQGENAQQLAVVAEDTITANSALSEFLAISMIGRTEKVDLTGFKESSDRDFLVNAWQEAMYQNPLAIGVSGIKIAKEGKSVEIAYKDEAKTRFIKQKELRAEVERVVAQVITPDMSDVEKEIALNNYLCDTVEYDQAALDSAQQNEDFVADEKYSDSFTAYGALIQKKGVCSGFAGAMKLLSDKAGLECIVVTGLLDGTLPHAWNRVKIGGEWRTVDTTNNNNPYTGNALLNLPDSAALLVLQPDEKYVVSDALSKYTAEDGSKEYYRLQGKYYDEDAIAEELVALLKKSDSVTLRTDYELEDGEFRAIVDKVLKQGKFKKLSGYTWLGVIYLAKEK